MLTSSSFNARPPSLSPSLLLTPAVPRQLHLPRAAHHLPRDILAFEAFGVALASAIPYCSYRNATLAVTLGPAVAPSCCGPALPTSPGRATSRPGRSPLASRANHARSCRQGWRPGSGEYSSYIVREIVRANAISDKKALIIHSMPSLLTCSLPPASACCILGADVSYSVRWCSLPSPNPFPPGCSSSHRRKLTGAA